MLRKRKTYLQGKNLPAAVIMNVPVPVICFPFPFPLTSTDCAPENTPENFCQSSIGAGAVYSLFSVKELYSLKAHSHV